MKESLWSSRRRGHDQCPQWATIPSRTPLSMWREPRAEGAMTSLLSKLEGEDTRPASWCLPAAPSDTAARAALAISIQELVQTVHSCGPPPPHTHHVHRQWQRRFWDNTWFCLDKPLFMRANTTPCANGIAVATTISPWHHRNPDGQQMAPQRAPKRTSLRSSNAVSCPSNAIMPNHRPRTRQSSFWRSSAVSALSVTNRIAYESLSVCAQPPPKQSPRIIGRGSITHRRRCRLSSHGFRQLSSHCRSTTNRSRRISNRHRLGRTSRVWRSIYCCSTHGESVL